jgi:ParB family chromosome partitioning protein
LNNEKSAIEAIKEMVRSEKKPKPKSAVLQLDKLHPFREHPYKVENNEEMAELVESIKQNGVLNPVIVRPSEILPECYEIISGHRRCRAAFEAGLNKVPALVYEIDRDEAAVMLVDSNLYRQNILPSEKAFAYKLKLDALKHQGQPSRQVGTKLRSDEEVASKTSDSARQVQRYIRLTNLVPELLQFVDEGKIGLSPAVELSYLDEETLRNLVDCIDELEKYPSHAQAIRLRKDFEAHGVNYNRVAEIMREDKPNQRETFRVPSERLKPVIPSGYTSKQAEDFIIKACEHYRKYLQKQREQAR